MFFYVYFIYMIKFLDIEVFLCFFLFLLSLRIMIYWIIYVIFNIIYNFLVKVELIVCFYLIY